MRGQLITNPAIFLAILATTTTGCVRYYAGLGYAGTSTVPAGYSLQGARPATQGYSAAASPPVLVVDTWSPEAGWGGGETPALEASGAVSADSAGVLRSAPSGASMSTGAAAGAAGVGCASGCAASGATSGGGAMSLTASLGGLCGGGAPAVGGGIARLDALGPLGVVGDDGIVLHADANVRVTASLAHDALPAAGGESAVVVRVEGLAPPAVVAPLRVHLVIDASTSMEGAWQDVKTAALAVVRRLRPEDELQIVVYGTGATEVLPPLAIGDGSRARGVIRGLRYGGRTNIEAGLRLAYGACRPAGRSLVVVISDGVPQGGLSTADELGALASRANADAGAVTLAVGLGTEFHTGILSALGAAGGGELQLAPRSGELAALLERALAARGAVVASDVEARVIASPGVTVTGDATARVGAITAGHTTSLVVPVTVGQPGPVAHVRVAIVLADGRPLELEASLSVGRASAPVPAGAIATVLDLSLAAALEAAGRSIENGDGRSAADTLRAHVAESRAAVPVGPLAGTLASRNEAVLRIAETLPALVAEASWGARRQAGASFAAHAFALRGTAVSAP